MHESSPEDMDRSKNEIKHEMPGKEMRVLNKEINLYDVAHAKATWKLNEYRYGRENHLGDIHKCNHYT